MTFPCNYNILVLTFEFLPKRGLDSSLCMRKNSRKIWWDCSHIRKNLIDHEYCYHFINYSILSIILSFLESFNGLNIQQPICITLLLSLIGGCLHTQHTFIFDSQSKQPIVFLTKRDVRTMNYKLVHCCEKLQFINSSWVYLFSLNETWFIA